MTAPLSRTPERPRVTHVITSLHHGGAQQVLVNFLSGQHDAGGRVDVVSLLDPGPLGTVLERRGIRVHALGLARGRLDPRGLTRLVARLRSHPPDLVQTWMYHADLLGGLAAQLARLPVVWGLHHTDLPAQGTRLTTRLTARACAGLSHRLPAAIVCCSEATRAAHAALGYAASPMVVVPNAVDTAAFKPAPEARAEVRRELGLPPDASLIGMVARFHPQKDHPTMIAAAARLAARWPSAHFLLAGEGVDAANPALAALVERAGLRDRVRLLGCRQDMPRLNAALDLATLTSCHGEGLPLSVCEAMAAGVPCVVTDVGEMKAVVGDTGRVVPPGDPEALAAAWTSVLALSAGEREALGAAARRRIEADYALPQMVARYEAVQAAHARRRP